MPMLTRMSLVKLSGLQSEAKRHEYWKGVCREEVRIHGSGRQIREAVGIGVSVLPKKGQKVWEQIRKILGEGSGYDQKILYTHREFSKK